MAVLAAAVLLAACADSDSPGGPTTTPAASAMPSPSPSAVTSTLQIFLHSGNADRCDEVVAVPRTVDGEATLLAAMRALVAGPTADETAQGLGGWFTHQTAGVVRRAEIANGVARVDFEDLRSVIPNASSSCGSAMLLAQLDSTARQFPSVTSTRYSIRGDERAFYEWLQRDVPPQPST